ncbi:MAG: prenyltransferase/squalene oxidase repeat-containing protein [Isosphaeraceae bacterium]
MQPNRSWPCMREPAAGPDPTGERAAAVPLRLAAGGRFLQVFAAVAISHGFGSLAIAAGDPGGAFQPTNQAQTAEERAIAYLAGEVPRWSRRNHCFSCHNNGDAARALYEAKAAGLAVPESALADTTAWLARPSGWDRTGGKAGVSDKRLARVAFASALAAASRTGHARDPSALRGAAFRLARDQDDDGSWRLEGEPAPGSPAAYGQSVATLLARETLQIADPDGFRTSIGRADGWILRREPVAVADASAVLMIPAVLTLHDGPKRRRQALDYLARAQGEDGGWGPFATSSPETFDTAIALLGLARSGDRSAPVQRAIARGRAFLLEQQSEDGSWPETTRPSGGTSYAQRMSTIGWAALALLATRDRAQETRPRSTPSFPSQTNRPRTP